MDFEWDRIEDGSNCQTFPKRFSRHELSRGSVKTFGYTKSLDYTMYRGYLYFLTKKHLSSKYAGKIDHSDIVQKTLLNAFTAREQFHGTTEAERISWLRTILIHQIVQATRKVKTKKRDIKREQSIEVNYDASSVRLGNHLVAEQSSPSQQAIRKEEISLIVDALERLPATQRQVLVLQFWEGCTIQQISDALGMSRPAVAGQLSRAKRKLRSLLGEHEARR